MFVLYFILCVDEEEPFKTYLGEWQSKQKSTLYNVNELRASYKEQIGYEAMKKQFETRAQEVQALETLEYPSPSDIEKVNQLKLQQQNLQIVLREVDEFLQTHFVPLMEQLIEFDTTAKSGVMIRPEWLKAIPKI